MNDPILPPMDDATYQAYWDALAGALQMVRFAPLREMKRVVSQAHSLGPIFDPTGYREGLSNLRDQDRMLDLLVPVQDLIREFEIAAHIQVGMRVRLDDGREGEVHNVDVKSRRIRLIMATGSEEVVDAADIAEIERTEG